MHTFVHFYICTYIYTYTFVQHVQINIYAYVDTNKCIIYREKNREMNFDFRMLYGECKRNAVINAVVRFNQANFANRECIVQLCYIRNQVDDVKRGGGEGWM